MTLLVVLLCTSSFSKAPLSIAKEPVRIFYGCGIDPEWKKYPKEYKDTESDLKMRVKLADSPRNRARLVHELAKLYLSAAKFTLAEKSLLEAIGLFSKTNQQDYLVRSLNLLASTYRLEGKTQLVEPTYQRALSVVNKMGPTQSDLRLELLTSWSSDVPQNSRLRRVLMSELTGNSFQGNRLQFRAKAASLLELSQSPRTKHQESIQLACQSFRAFRSAEDPVGMLQALVRLDGFCQKTSIECCHIPEKLEQLLTLANLSGREGHNVLLSASTKKLMEKCIVLERSDDENRKILTLWAQGLRQIKETDPVRIILVRRMSSNALAYAARLDWHLNKYFDAETEFQTSIQLSQQLADEVRNNGPALKERLMSQMRSNLAQSYKSTLQEGEELEECLNENYFLADEAFALLGLSNLDCSLKKLDASEREYRKARTLPVAFTNSILASVATQLAEAYEEDGNEDKARQYFHEIKGFYGSHWIIPSTDSSYEDAVVGHIPSQTDCINRCIQFMNNHPESDDAKVLAHFNEFKKNVSKH